jgi:hypothetical protein
MTTERKLRGAANFFIWSAVVVLVVNSFSIFDRWSRTHTLQGPSIETLANFVGFLAGGLLYNDWLYILVLVNGLVLRRYKSRIAAGLFVVLGLWGTGLALFVLWRVGFTQTSALMAVFFGPYLLIAGWTFAALTRPWPTFGDAIVAVRVWRRSRPQARADVYYPLISKAVSQLPIYDHDARQRVYATARMVLAERSAPGEFERERRALETAIRRVEHSAPKITMGNLLHRPTTISLVISLFFPRLWLIDVTCFSLYWVGRLPKL